MRSSVSPKKSLPMKTEWLDDILRQSQGKKVISTENPCPDCGDDPDEQDLHRDGCRRIINEEGDRLYLQFGPPWHEWDGPQ